MRVWTYRHYVANSLKYIPQDKYIQESLFDILNPKPVDDRPAEDIVMDVMQKAGLTFGE